MATPSPNSDPSAAESTYSTMDNGDVEAIGAHCQLEYCHVLDFLPFRCDSCRGTFCLDHRSETAHKCTHAGEWARNRRRNNNNNGLSSNGPTNPKPTVLTAQQCSNPVCKTFINTPQNVGVHCSTCNRQYCLKHRFQEDHDCKNLTPLGARPLDQTIKSNAEKVRLGFTRLRSWGAQRQSEIRPKPAPTSRAAQLVALNALKKSARGDDEIPTEKRVYLHVEAESPRTSPDLNASAPAKPPKKDLFFSADWSVGKMLDQAAGKLGVDNKNNRVESEDQRLRVYHVETGTVLEFGEKVGQRLGSGNTIVLLRGIGPAS